MEPYYIHKEPQHVFCSGNIFNFIKVNSCLCTVQFVLTFGNHEEPRSGIASLTMYDITLFTFGKKVMATTGSD